MRKGTSGTYADSKCSDLAANFSSLMVGVDVAGVGGDWGGGAFSLRDKPCVFFKCIFEDQCPVEFA